MTWKPKNAADRNWLRGVMDAAALADTYNSVTSHPYQLGDCILAKLNLTDTIRPNKRAARVAPEGGEAPSGSCLICGRLRTFAVWHGSGHPGVCKFCRDARWVIEGGATYKTVLVESADDVNAAGDRIMQHYLGDEGADYGDARFLYDAWLRSQTVIRDLRDKLARAR